MGGWGDVSHRPPSLPFPLSSPLQTILPSPDVEVFRAIKSSLEFDIHSLPPDPRVYCTVLLSWGEEWALTRALTH